MEQWLPYAIMAMLTGGITMVFAKLGMGSTNEHIALVIRTSVLLAMVLGNAWYAGALKGIGAIGSKTVFWLVLTGLSTAIYWILYFKALKTANVSVVATIDRAGIIITVLLSYFFLKEPLTLRLLVGMCTILAGTVILVWK